MNQLDIYCVTLTQRHVRVKTIVIYFASDTAKTTLFEEQFRNHSNYWISTFSVCVIEHKYYTTHNVPVHFTDIDGTETKPLSIVCEFDNVTLMYSLGIYLVRKQNYNNSSCLIKEIK